MAAIWLAVNSNTSLFLKPLRAFQLQAYPSFLGYGGPIGGGNFCYLSDEDKVFVNPRKKNEDDAQSSLQEALGKAISVVAMNLARDQRVENHSKDYSED